MKTTEIIEEFANKVIFPYKHPPMVAVGGEELFVISMYKLKLHGKELIAAAKAERDEYWKEKIKEATKLRLA